MTSGGRAGWPLAASQYHTLSSYGWFDQPDIDVISGGQREPGVALDELPADAVEVLVALLRHRRSRRAFVGTPISADQLELLLWCGYGAVGDPVEGISTCPSAGGLRTLRLLVLTPNVVGLDAGVYSYVASDRTLRLLDISPPAPLGRWFRTTQIPYELTSAIVVITVDLVDSAARYGERAYRYVLIEAGHAAQNICLASTALGLTAVPIGGVDDEVIEAALPRLTGGVAIYAVAIGTVAEVSSQTSDLDH